MQRDDGIKSMRAGVLRDLVEDHGGAHVGQVPALLVDGLPPCIQFSFDRTSRGLRALLWIDATAPARWRAADEVWTTMDDNGSAAMVRWVLAFEGFNRRALREAERRPDLSRAQLPPGAEWLG